MSTDGEKFQLIIPDLESIEEAARQTINRFPGYRVFAFHGSMGAGKTTFIKALCRVLGVTENVSSPTFALVNEYLSSAGNPVYHFDFYRINSPQEAIDIGCGEYFTSGHYCFIEWPEKILNLLPLNHLPVFVRVLADDHRLITFYD